MLENRRYTWNCQGQEDVEDVRFMDVVREDMRDLRVTEKDATNRGEWKKTIRSGDP